MIDHKEVIDHIKQRHYNDVESYNEHQAKWERRMEITLLVFMLLFGGYMLVHVGIWLWK